MQQTILVPILLTLLAIPYGQAQEVSLFNGRNLDGWAGLPQIWSVKDGAITGRLNSKNNPGKNTFIVWQGGEVMDFDFTCKYKLTPEDGRGIANSGVQFRADYLDQATFELHGYQGEMDPGTLKPDLFPEGGGLNGCLMEDGGPGGALAHVGQKVIIHAGPRVPKGVEGRIEVVGTLAPDSAYRKLYRARDWNDYRIVAAGNHIQVFVNGQQTVDVVDEVTRTTKGLLGLQIHCYNKDAKTVQFKDLKLKRLQANQPAFTSTTQPSSPIPVGIPNGPSQSAMDTLTKQAPNAIEWALAPLDQTVPGDIRQNLTFLREDLLDEGKTPKASPDAYKLGAQICNTLLAALEERGQTLARAGFRAVEANARTGVTSEALEARRNYKMSWPQFAREESQRAELKSDAINKAEVLKELPKKQWVERTAAHRKTLDALYQQYREALRQGAK